MNSENKINQSQSINDVVYTAGDYFYVINRSNININNNRLKIVEFVQGKRGVLMRFIDPLYNTKTTLNINNINKKNKTCYHITKDCDIADISYHEGHKFKDIEYRYNK